MADIITLTPQPIRVTSITRQPIFLALDISAYDFLDIELVCAVEGTATNANVNLVTGMQVATEDGWIVTASNFAPLSGTGQQITRETITSGLLQFLRWDVSSLGGAASLTFFIRGIARARAGGGTVVGVAAAYYGGASPADQTLLIQSTNGGPLVIKAHGASTGPLLQVEDSSGNQIASFSDNAAITFLTEAPPAANASSYVFDSVNDMTVSGDFFHARFRNAGNNWIGLSGATGQSYVIYNDPSNGNVLGEDTWAGTSPFHTELSFGADGASTHHVLDTNNSITNTSAKLLSVRNQGTEKLAALQSGTLVPGTDGAQNLGSSSLRFGNIYIGNNGGAGAQGVVWGASGAGRLSIDDSTGTVLGYSTNTLIVDSINFTLSNGGGGQVIRTGCGDRHVLNTKTANYTIHVSDYYLGVDTTSSAVTLTLPSPASAGAGATFVVYDWKNTFGTNNLTIARSGTEKIDNTAANKVLNTSGARTQIWTDGTDWFTK